jgi:hypothetical protein
MTAAALAPMTAADLAPMTILRHAPTPTAALRPWPAGLGHDHRPPMTTGRLRA